MLKVRMIDSDLFRAQRAQEIALTSTQSQANAHISHPTHSKEGGVWSNTVVSVDKSGNVSGFHH